MQVFGAIMFGNFRDNGKAELPRPISVICSHFFAFLGNSISSAPLKQVYTGKGCSLCLMQGLKKTAVGRN